MVQARLTERPHINKATMASIPNGLEAKGLVERQPYAGDKRALERDTQLLTVLNTLGLCWRSQGSGILSYVATPTPASDPCRHRPHH